MDLALGPGGITKVLLHCPGGAVTIYFISSNRFLSREREGYDMVQFLNAAATYFEIENLISFAENRLVLISPYVQISRILFERLYAASERRGVNIALACRRNDLKQDEYMVLHRISRLEIRDLPRLNAKCFYNEKSMIITSLNLVESQVSHREMGILMTREREPKAFADAVEEAESMMQMALLVKVNEAGERLDREPARVPQFLSTDIRGDLRRAFPTFSKILSQKKAAVN
jgi:hypothetical protein